MRITTAVCLVLLQFSCQKVPPDPVTFTGETMGTRYSVQIAVYPQTVALELLHSTTDNILDEVNQAMSTYIEDSELSVINHLNTTEPIPISAVLFDVISSAITVSRRTDGAFDITIGALVDLWGFGPTIQQHRPPEADDIATALNNSGYSLLTLTATPPSLRKQYPGMYLDLSGIAKGYAVDRVAAFLDEQGITDYLVEIGGEIRARGRNQNGEPWRIGIEKPLVDRREVAKRIHLADMAMATSGDYRNFFEYEGRRYSHTLDPRTGWPVAHDLASVTVIDNSAMMADALATALLVMGPEEGYRYAGQNNIPALFIIHNNGGFRTAYTAAFEPYQLE